MIRFFDFWKIIMIIFCGSLMLVKRKFIVTKKQIGFSFALVSYVLSVLDYTIFPIPIDAKVIASFGIGNTGAADNFTPFATIRSMLLAQNVGSFMNLAGNIIFMIPVGFFVPLMIKRSCRLWQVLLVGLLSSMSIETGQYLISRLIHFSYRSTDIDDVIINVLGAVIGYGLYQIWRIFARGSLWNRSYFTRIMLSIILAAAVLAAVFGYELYTHDTPQRALAYEDSGTLPIESIPVSQGEVLISTLDPSRKQQTGYMAWYYVKDQFGLWMLKQKVVCTESVIMNLQDGVKFVWGFDMQNVNRNIRFEYQNQIYQAKVDDLGFWYQIFQA